MYKKMIEYETYSQKKVHSYREIRYDNAMFF